MASKFPEGLCGFYRRVYEVVDDPSLDSIISWNKSNNGFVIWNLEDLVHKRIILRFRCTKLSDLPNQLETYGFTRVKGSEHLEFGNPNFVRGQTDLLREMQIEAAMARWSRKSKARKARKAMAKLDALKI